MTKKRKTLGFAKKLLAGASALLGAGCYSQTNFTYELRNPIKSKDKQVFHDRMGPGISYEAGSEEKGLSFIIHGNRDRNTTEYRTLGGASNNTITLKDDWNFGVGVRKYLLGSSKRRTIEKPKTPQRTIEKPKTPQRTGIVGGSMLLREKPFFTEDYLALVPKTDEENKAPDYDLESMPLGDEIFFSEDYSALVPKTDEEKNSGTVPEQRSNPKSPAVPENTIVPEPEVEGPEPEMEPEVGPRNNIYRGMSTEELKKSLEKYNNTQLNAPAGLIEELNRRESPAGEEEESPIPEEGAGINSGYGTSRVFNASYFSDSRNRDYNVSENGNGGISGTDSVAPQGNEKDSRSIEKSRREPVKPFISLEAIARKQDSEINLPNFGITDSSKGEWKYGFGASLGLKLGRVEFSGGVEFYPQSKNEKLTSRVGVGVNFNF